MKKYFVACVISVLILVEGSLTATAEGIHREEVLSLVQKALINQGSISEEVRTEKEIKEKLNQNFTKEFTEKFYQANVMKVEGGYMAFGSDFAPYYIPFFSFNENTEIIFGESSEYIYVQEKFEESEEGPTTSKNHYESVTLKNENNVWKVDDVSYESENLKVSVE